MRKLNNKGTTLVEMLIVIVILGIIGSVAYPMIFMNEKITTGQIDESAKRNEIRALENFLKEDLRNSKTYSPGGSEDDYIYIVNSNDGSLIKYKQEINDKGKVYISRERGSELITFQEINELKLNTRIENKKLIEIEITSTDGKGDPYLHNSKVARWEWLIKNKNTTPFYTFLIDQKLFVFGGAFKNNGNLVNASDATIFITSDIKSSDMSGGANLKISNIFVDGNLTATAGHKIGVDWLIEGTEVGNIVVSKNMDIRGGADVYGNIYIQGDLNHSNGTIHAEEIVVGGDAYISGGAKIIGDLYVMGNLYLTSGNLDNNAFVKNNVEVSGGFSFDANKNNKVFYLGNVTYPNYYSYKDRFIKETNIGSPELILVPNIEIPLPKDESWYLINGYETSIPIGEGKIGNGKKIISKGHVNQSVTNIDADNMIIVSLEGNITLSSNYRKMSGLLFAPQGSINLNGIESFAGIAIAKDGVFHNQGGSQFVFMDIQDLIPDENDYPFIIQE